MSVTASSMIALGEGFFSSFNKRGTKQILIPMKNRTPDLRLPRSDALPLSHRKKDNEFWAR